MAIQRTRWTLDTCGCVIEYVWDDAVADDVREHTVATVRPCQEHPAGADHVGKVLERDEVPAHAQNVRRNAVLDEVRQRLGNDEGVVLTWEGQDAARTLVVDLRAVPPAARGALASAIRGRVSTGVRVS